MTIALTIAGAMTPAGIGGCVIAMMQRGLSISSSAPGRTSITTCTTR